MFDHVLSSYIKPDSPRILPKLRQAVSGLSVYVEQIIERYTAVAGYETDGMQLLEQIIGDSNISKVRSYRDDFDRYVAYLLPLQEDIVRPIDAGAHGNYVFGTFVAQTNKGRSYLFPIACANYLQQLPMNQDWSEWQTLRPLRLLYNDSPDLSLHAYMDKLYYSKHPPAHVVMGLDGVMLIMQYAKYLDTHVGEAQLSLVNYLHRYVIYPALLHDSVTAWLCRQYTHILTCAADASAKPKFSMLSTPSLGHFGSQFPAALDEIWAVAQTAQTATLPPTRLLASLMLQTGSVSHGYHTLRRYTEIPPLRQNYWMQYLTTLGWRNLVFATISLSRLHPMTKSACVWIRRDYRLLQASRFWMSIPDVATRNYIETDLLEKMALLDSID